MPPLNLKYNEGADFKLQDTMGVLNNSSHANNSLQSYQSSIDELKPQNSDTSQNGEDSDYCEVKTITNIVNKVNYQDAVLNSIISEYANLSQSS